MYLNDIHLKCLKYIDYFENICIFVRNQMIKLKNLNYESF